MSGYAHQAEREHSNHSLSSGRGSGMESRDVMETGFYMTPFAAIIFIAALVTVGVLLITLLVALAVMLHSCENRCAGVVDTSKSYENYSYCKIFTLHAELNKVDVSDFPEICKITAVYYVKEGQYSRDLNLTIGMAEDYFNSVKPLEDGLDLVLMDIDDFFPSSTHYDDPLLSRFSLLGCEDCLREAENLKHKFIRKLYTKLQEGGWLLVLFSRKPENQRNAIIEHLISAGYGAWSSLVMRLGEELQMDSSEHLSRLRNTLQKQGFRIKAVISSQMDAFTGPHSGKRMFKLPSLIYHNTDNYNLVSQNLPQ
ncbi:hypothetical protein RHGRI_007976 [Rhododendron griersonianum]|uniref:Acid phosphatase n=1 Tax=Rhododendron griersonianum TaxID=479676 RepID=A0AAV6KYK7_9ERIC|nr:hypothetical protein RHGRI_007976 [Rhododendron griersonianum]